MRTPSLLYLFAHTQTTGVNANTCQPCPSETSAHVSQIRTGLSPLGPVCVASRRRGARGAHKTILASPEGSFIAAHSETLAPFRVAASPPLPCVLFRCALGFGRVSMSSTQPPGPTTIPFLANPGQQTVISVHTGRLLVIGVHT